MKKFIIDVGTSHNAPRGIKLKKELNLPVIFIEPNESSLNQVPIDDGDIKINAAITSYDGEVEFNYYQDGTHSILETNLEEIHKFIDGYSGTYATVDNWKSWKKEKVKCHKLSTLIKELEIDEVPHLKIDTQGHDFEVIKSLEEKISIVKYIECEVQITDFEIYKNQSKKEDLVKYLKEHNFELVSEEKQTYDQEENLIFKNKNLTPIEVSYINGQKILISPSSLKYNYYTWEGMVPYQLDAIEFFYNKIPMYEPINIIDIGAQSGSFSLMSKFLPNTTWYCFEPDSLNYELLLENLKINDIKNVSVFTTAISSTSGEDTININLNHRGLNTLGKNLKRFSEDETQKTIVTINSLDNLFFDKKIDFIKIDTEGAEYDILLGAKKVIEKYKPKILMEYYNDNLLQFDKTLTDLDNLIYDLGYVITWQKDDNVLIEPK